MADLQENGRWVIPCYEYECLACKKHQDAVRAVDERDNAPRCICGADTQRVFAPPRAIQPEGEVGYQPAFGKTFSSRRELRNEIRRLREEKGIDMVEVGNDRPKVKKPEKKPDVRAAYQELRRAEHG